MRVKLTIAFTAILLICFVNLSYAPEPLKFAVHVSVTCDNPSVKASIESHVKRELRSLQDVLLVSAQAKNYFYIYELRFVAVEHHYKNSGQKSGGISIAYLFLQKFNDSYTKNVLLSAQSRKAIEPFIDNIFYEHRFGVQIYNTENIDKMCKSFVVDFDTDTLERIRKIRRQNTLYGNP